MIAARKIIEKLAIAGSILLLLALAAAAQSSDQNFPTPVTTNEIEGTIKVRDMGDSRVTSYFYAFDGGQGDIFINVVTRNFSGDIDIFAVEGLTPLAKMVVYADAGASETGRLIYLRKPERMILRIEGRTPNDDPATFRIKFGGSFIALTPQKVDDAPTVAKAGSDEPGVKVNSVGTIVAVIPKPRPTPKPEPPVVAKAEPTPGRDASVNERAAAEPATAKVTKPKTPPAKKPADTTKTTILENEKATVTVEEPPKPDAVEREPTNAPKAVKKSGPPASAVGKTAKSKTTPTSNPTATPPEPKPPEAKPGDPLANVRLVIQMKDGTTFWMPMNDVVKFTVDKGVMTVIAKNGSTTRYNILDVEKTTIQ